MKKNNNSIFRFKEFNILHGDSVMKVGTDGVLLGAAVKCEDAKCILDIGTGTGLIALMIAQRSDAEIYAIDINENAVELAKYNIEQSNWADRMQVYHTRLQDFHPKHSFDLIVSNPPFFNTDVLAPNKDRAIARHALELSICDLIEFAKDNLSDVGRLVVIYPIEQTNELIKCAKGNGLFLKSKFNIYPKYNYGIVRIITEITNAETEYSESELYIEKYKRQEYTEEHKELTKDYYIKTLKKT